MVSHCSSDKDKVLTGFYKVLHELTPPPSPGSSHTTVSGSLETKNSARELREIFYVTKLI